MNAPDVVHELRAIVGDRVDCTCGWRFHALTQRDALVAATMHALAA